MSSVERGKRLRERAEENPEAVSIDEILNSLRNGPVGERSHALRALVLVTEDHPERADEAREALVPMLSATSAMTRELGARTLSVLAQVHPDSVRPAIPELIDLLEDDFGLARARAVRALASIADSDPESVTAALSHLEGLLTDEALFVREPAIDLTARYLPERADEVAFVAPALVETLEPPETLDPETRRALQRGSSGQQPVLEHESEARRERERTRVRAAATLASLSEERPDTLTDSLPSLLDLLEAESSVTIQSAILDVLGHTATEPSVDPTPAIDPVAKTLSDAVDPTLRTKAAWVLGLIAESEPEAVTEASRSALQTIGDLLEADDVRMQGAAAGLLAYVAEYDPEAVSPLLTRLRTLLESDADFVRGSAIWVLAFAGEDADRERLAALTREDADPDVRSAATAAVEIFDERSGR